MEERGGRVIGWRGKGGVIGLKAVLEVERKKCIVLWCT